MCADRNCSIELRAFEKYYGQIHAVKPLDLTVEAGETFALLGPNGSGKSSVLRGLAGLHFPTSGQALICNMDVVVNSVAAKRMVSYMPQRVSMPETLTAREVVTLYAKLRRVEVNRVDEILDFVALSNDADRSLGEFSGGMLQRVGLAIAFLNDACVYLLDEPTLNLDAMGIKRLHKRLLELKKQGTTVLFSSHILQDALQLADRVGILVDGKMCRVESVADFKKEIARQTSVRIVLSDPLDNMAGIIQSAGAQSTICNSRSCTFKADPNSRLSVIRAIESAGGIVQEFHTDPPNWEALLHQNSQPNANHEH